MSDTPETSPDFLAPIPKPKTSGCVRSLQVIAVIGILGFVVSLLLPEVRRVRPAAQRSQCKNNLKQIGLALHNYHDEYGALPPAYTVDSDGQPLHSWRTLILPYIDQKPLYDSIDLSKPWNDPANAKAYGTRVTGYECPSAIMANNFTTYLAVVGKDCCFDPTQSRKFRDITDGLSNTVGVIEVSPAQAVHWMSPLDAYKEMAAAPGTRMSHHEGGHAILMDGSVRYIAAKTPIETVRKLLTINGGEVIEDF